MTVGYQELSPGVKRRFGAGGSSATGNWIVKPIFSKVKLSAGSSTVNLGFTGFDMDNDTLLVFKNSTFMFPNEYYSVISNTQIQATSGEIWKVGDEFYFVALMLNDAPTAVKQSSIKNTVTITQSKTFIAVGMEFDHTQDTLMLFKNGVYQELDVDYTTDDIYIYPKGVTTFNASTTNPISFNILVIKNVIDGAVLTNFDGQYLKPGSVTEDKLDPAILKKAYSYTDKTKSDLLGGADAAYDTLKELENELKNDDNIANGIINSIGALSSLSTSTKSNLVGAINEVFQSGNNVKQSVVDALVAVGIPVSTSNSWADIVNAIKNEISLNPFNKINQSDLFMATKNFAFSLGQPFVFIVNNNLYMISLTGTYVYDIRSNTLNTLASKPTMQYGFSAVLYNNKIYCVGGTDVSVLEIYDIDSNTWSPGASLPCARASSTSHLYNGKIYTIGGVYWNPTNNRYSIDNTNNIIVYDIASNTWNIATTCPTRFETLTEGSYGSSNNTVSKYHKSVIKDNTIYIDGDYPYIYNISTNILNSSFFANILMSNACFFVGSILYIFTPYSDDNRYGYTWSSMMRNYTIGSTIDSTLLPNATVLLSDTHDYNTNSIVQYKDYIIGVSNYKMFVYKM